MINPTARPKTVTFILAMLILLAVISAITVGTSLLFARSAFGGTGSGRQFNGTPQPGRTLGNGTPVAGDTGTGGNTQGNGTGQGTGGNFPGAGNGQGTGGNFTGGQNGTGGNFQGRNQGGFSMVTIIRALGLPFQLIAILNIAIPVIGILLLLFSAFGVWKLKPWGLNLATLMGLIFLIGAISALLTPVGRTVNWLRIGENALSLAATLPILGLSFLPSVRDYFPKPAPKPRSK